MCVCVRERECEFQVATFHTTIQIRCLPVLTVSPNNWNLAFCPRNTPAVTGPLCNPIRTVNSVVSGL